MSLVKGFIKRFYRPRVVEVGADWAPQGVWRVLVPLACGEANRNALLAEARRRFPTATIETVAMRRETSPPDSEVADQVVRGASSWLSALLWARRQRFDLCCIPATGEGGKWLKLVGALSGARLTVLCPAPHRWYLWERNVGRSASLARAISPVVALVRVIAVSGYILARRPLVQWRLRNARETSPPPSR